MHVKLIFRNATGADELASPVAVEYFSLLIASFTSAFRAEGWQPLHNGKQTEINLSFENKNCANIFLESLRGTCEKFNKILKANNVRAQTVLPEFRLNSTDQFSDKVTYTVDIGLAQTMAWS